MGSAVGSRRRSGAALLSLSLAFTLMMSVVAAADAATVTNGWRATIGSGGANGTATLQAYTTGTGSITLKLAKMKPATYLPVKISKGTCSSVGSTLITFPAIKTTSTGAAARTSSLTASQTTLIKNATAMGGRIAIRVGSATTGGVKCGLFTVLVIPPYVAANVTVGRTPLGVVVTQGGVWVTNYNDNTLSKIDPATNTTIQTVRLTINGNGGPVAIAYGENSLWVTVVEFDANGNLLPGSVLRVDPATGTQQATIPVGKAAFDIAAMPGSVWVPLEGDDTVARIDPATNAVATTVPVTGSPSGVDVGAGAVWVVSRDGKVVRIDPATNQIVATIAAQDTGGYVAVAGASVWVTNPGYTNDLYGSITRIDTATNAVTAKVEVGNHPEDIAYAGGSLWVGLFDDPFVVQVSATANTVLSRVSVGNPVVAIAATDHAVWAVHALSAPDQNTPPPAGSVSRVAY
jgi:YVTN family beta-propeller protein